MQNKDIFEKLAGNLGGKSKINEGNIASLMLQNRSEIKSILDNEKNLYKNENGNTSWYLFFADFREYLGIPRFMNLDTFNAFSEVIMTSGEDLNYDDFLKVFKKSHAKSVTGKKYKGVNVSKLINNQGEYIAQGLVELVANAIDATVTDKNIGRFGEGFYQSLKFLKGGDSKIIVQTKASGEKGFQISIKNESGENLIGSVGIEKENKGTEVILEKKLSKIEQENLKSFLISRFQTNKKVNVILNSEKVNKLEEYIYYNGESLILPKEEVQIKVNENGFRVIDSGIGMSSRDLSEKLLSPNMSGKKRLNSDSMTDSQIEKHTSEETAFFYKHFKEDKKQKINNETKEQKTNIRLQVGGVLIENFEANTSYNIEEFCLELPSFTWLPESRNKIELTKEVVVSLKMAIEKISDKVSDEKEKLMLIEIVAKIIKHLKSRESSKASTKSKYDINKVSKEAFKKIKSELEASGKVVIASINGIQDILANQDNIVFVDEELLNFDITKIPNIQKLVNIKNKQKEFYEIEFGENSKYDYLILNTAVLVNSKYTTNPSDLAKINAQVNLNTGYEQGSDIVFYGIIEDNEVFKEKKESLENKLIDNKLENKDRIEKIKLIVQNQKILIEEFGNYKEYFSEIIEQNEYIVSREYIVPLDDEYFDFYTNYTKLGSLNLFKFLFLPSNTIKKFALYPFISFSDNFYQKFYNFALENNEGILKVFINFSRKIYKIENPEKYLLQVMDLLEDENNAKYIIEYLKEFEDLSGDDIHELFAKFEGVEIEKEIEENETLKDLTIIKNYLKENNLTFYSALSAGENNEILIHTEEGKNILFIGDKIFDEFGGQRFDYLQDIHIGPYGDLRGVLRLEWERKLFKDNGKIIIDNFKNKKITGLSNIHSGENGDLRGDCEIDYSKTYSFKDDFNHITKKLGGNNYNFLDDYVESKLIKGKWENFIGDIMLKDFFNSNETYPQKISSFVEFLCKGGEFLQEQENRVDFESQNNLLLTDIIGISRYFDDEIESLSDGDGLKIISSLKEEISKKLKNRIPFERNITSTIDGQDRASMIWLRESVQNSRDAILKAKRNGKPGENLDNLEVDFYQNNNSWISRISDNIGMTSYEVFKYLLTPGKSGKEGDETATGMFGQGFYSLAIGAKEINLKTSNGNGKTTYLNLKPKYNENKDIIDFEIKYDIKSEEFEGTIIERFDENEGIGGNIGALIGINNLQKYVGNLDDIEIKYNGKNAINPSDIQILETEIISEIGKLSLKKNKDKQERLTKDNLFLSEIKDEYLNFLPDFMIEYVKKNGYSLDLPSKIELTKTRNAITDFEENIEILRPSIFNIFTKHIIKDYLAGKTRLPMMPLDYYGLDLYEMRFDNRIMALANRVNSGGVLDLREIEQLKDKNLMIQYLINLQVENKGEIISIRELKKRRDDEAFLRKHTNDIYAINNMATSLNSSMEFGDRKKIALVDKIDLNEKEEKEAEKIKEFLEKVDMKFSPLVKRLFDTSIDFGFYLRKDKDESRTVDYGFDTSGKLYFYFNSSFASIFINEEEHKTIELITHEFTHLVEEFVKGYGIDFDKVLYEGKNFKDLVGNKINWQNTGFGSHQKDLEHEHSFEKIQRDILKMMTRERL